MTATIWSGIYVEWDEPGAGALCKDGKRLIHFSIDTDWSEPWEPQVNEVGLALIDQFPRMQQEVDMALETARKYEAEWKNAVAENGRDGAPS